MIIHLVAGTLGDYELILTDNGKIHLRCSICRGSSGIPEPDSQASRYVCPCGNIVWFKALDVALPDAWAKWKQEHKACKNLELNLPIKWG